MRQPQSSHDSVAEAPKPRIGRPPGGIAHNRKLNEKKVRQLAQAGLSTYDIAKHQGVGQSRVWRFLDRLKIEQKQVEEFKSNRAEVFASLQGLALSVQEKALKYLLQDGIFEGLEDKAKVSLINSVNNVFGTAYDKERLERGESTQNISMVSRMIDSRIGSLHKRNPLKIQESDSPGESHSLDGSVTIDGAAGSP